MTAQPFKEMVHFHVEYSAMSSSHVEKLANSSGPCTLSGHVSMHVFCGVVMLKFPTSENFISVGHCFYEILFLIFSNSISVLD